jgi:hypothetical protein
LADELLQSERAREEIVRNDREVLAQVIDTVPAFIIRPHLGIFTRIGM